MSVAGGGGKGGGRASRAAPLRRAKTPASPAGGRDRRRYVASLAVTSACLGAILARLLLVQGVDAGRYLQAAQSEYVQQVSYLGERGSILARNGDVLAMSVPMTTIYADPYQVTNPRAEATALAGPLGLAEATLQSELSEPSGFVYLAHTVANSTAAKVGKLISDGALTGIYTMQQPKPFYPAGQLAAPLLGVVGADGQGLSGLEYQYNSLLQGKPGKLVADVGPAGGEIPGGLHQYQAPVRGDDLVLSLDEPLQYDAEEDLARTLIASRAQSGVALVMQTHTGQLLAAAELSTPSASNPATLQEPPALPVWFIPPWDTLGGKGPNSITTAALARLQPVESPTATAFDHVYEPGSVEKLITFSAALQSGAITPYEHFVIPNTINIDGSVISDAWTHPTLDWTASNIVAHSSDIGTIEVAEKMGMPTLLKYIYDFGLGHRTDIDFPGGTPGLVPGPSQWSGTTIATVPIGQGIAVTAIQMLDAYNTIANGGVYLAPRLAVGYIGPNGKEHLFPHPKPRRVVSTLVAKEVTTALEGVATVGTGEAANMGPYTVAGKTGTGLMPTPQGGYYNYYFTSSFAGFVPAEDPAITVMVVVRGTMQYGAEAAAPVFAMIARDALQQLGIPPHKPVDLVPGMPLATPLVGSSEGNAAGPAIPGLAGAPNVYVNPGATGAPPTGAAPTGAAPGPGR